MKGEKKWKERARKIYNKFFLKYNKKGERKGSTREEKDKYRVRLSGDPL